MAQTPTCPRCGYDLSGIIASWTNSCPLTGICSECGLEFRWRDLLGHRAQYLPGFFEHAVGVRRSFRWAWRTWAWTIIPSLFWSRVRMHHRVSPKRILLWPVVLILPMYVLGSLAGTLAVWAPIIVGRIPYYDHAWPVTLGQWTLPVVHIERSWGGRIAGYRIDVEPMVGYWPIFIPVGLAASLVLVALFVLLSDTRKMSKVRTVHAVRVGVYSLAWLVPVAGLHLFHRMAMSAYLIDLAFGPLQRSVGMWERSAFWLESFIDRHWFAPLAIVLAWIGTWWFVALDRGLEMRHARRIWCTLMIPAALTALIAFLLMYSFKARHGAWG